MTTLNLNNINDDLIELNRDTFNNKKMSFNIPGKHQRVSQNNFMNDDVLFNKNKISNDVISMLKRTSLLIVRTFELPCITFTVPKDTKNHFVTFN